jgi:hypothetical protein
MRLLEKMCFVVLASGLALGQATAPNSGSAGTGSVADELKALREAISQQQQQIAQQQQQLQTLQQQLDSKTSGTPHVADAALRTAPVPVAATTVVQETEKPKESPLSFRIGGADFTPGGFVDFENVFRTTNTGNVTATNFWAIPFNNTAAGHLTEYRSTGQYSRINLKASTKFKGTDVTGYVEADFNGNDATNVFITSNGHTMRLRVYWVDLKPGKWEFLGGSTWGLQTPNRTGISPMPSDLSLTYGEDAQTHVGINYTRAAEFRAGYHFSKQFAWAVALQNPQQYIGQNAGGNNEVIFPAAFAALVGQFDNNATAGAPNAFPDFITKFAFDGGSNGHKFHAELGGLTTSAKVAVVPTVAGAGFVKHTKMGAGGFGAFNFELIKNLRVLAQGMWGPGTGRYLISMGPQVVAVPVPATAGGVCTSGATGGCDVNLSMVHAGDALVGIEAQPMPKTQLGFYYGGAYFGRNTFPDISAPGAVKPFIGFGNFGAAAGVAGIMNRSLQEGSIDWTQTFWKSPQYGAVLLVTQASYVTRSPWVQAVGNPKNAHLTMGYVSVRYVLP